MIASRYATDHHERILSADACGALLPEIVARQDEPMAFESLFFPALGLLILGNGAFKPNVSAQVGSLYAPGDGRRDRAFSIFYVGINLGAFLAPLVCGYLGERWGWHYGFGAAGVGMVLGLCVYLAGRRLLPRPKPVAVVAETAVERDEERSRLFGLAAVCLVVVLFWAVYEQMGNTMHILEVPQCKGPCDRDLFRAELVRYKDALERLTGNTITPERLAAATKVVNAKRRVLQRLARLRAADPAPISGRDALLINQISFYDDPIRFTAKIGALCDEMESRIAAGQGVAPAKTPRLLLAGCPMAVPNWKLPYLIESSGAVIVGEESCIGERNTRDYTDESPTGMDAMLDALTDRYLKIDCACFTPNPERLEHIAVMAKDLHADGVVHYGLLFCQPYAHEAFKVGRAMTEAGMPFLALETDYGMEDAGQLKTRVEAFVETLR